VRTFISASSGDNPKLLAEVRQLDNKIGHSAKAMRDLRWEIDEPVVDEPDPEPNGNGASRTYVPKKA